MLTLEKMQKVRVISLRDNAPEVTEALYDFGAIQVEECKIAELDKPLSAFEKISEMLIKLRAEERTLNLKGAPDVKLASLQEMERAFRELQLEEIDGIERNLQEGASKKEDLESRLLELQPFRNLNIQIEPLKSERVNFAYLKLKPKSDAHLSKALKKINHQALEVGDGKERYLLVAYDRSKEQEVTELLQKHAAAIYPIPSVQRGFAAEILQIEGELKSLKKEIADLRAQEREYKEKFGPKLLELKEQLIIASQKAELPFKFGKTEHFSVVEGWIEARNLAQFRKLMEASGNILETYKTGETPPSKLNNPKFIRPFEFLIEFFSLPKSYEYDPTLFISITFPLFFGMIMGDIGYGLLSLFAALYIKLKAKAEFLQRIGGMLALSATSAIIFGIIFGEFFGLEHIFGTDLVPLIHRTKEVEEMINIAILIGVLHISLGFILGSFTQWKEGHKGHAVAKLAWLMMEISLIALVINLAHVPLLEIFGPLKEIIGLQVASAGFILSALLIAYLESPTHLFEIPTLISNTLSYLRIVALGVSGVVLAFIINKMPVDFDLAFAMLTGSAPLNIGSLLAFLIFGIMLVLGHILALALGILESGVQSLRLHYVEFFSKFYEGGGIPFRPLRIKKTK